MENERDFKGVWIPKTVWLDKRLNALDKVILTEIDSLDNGERGCWASNKHIAEFCQCSETKVSTAISKLIEYGYLYVKSFDGRQRILKSSLSNFERQDFKNCNSDFQNSQESNTNNKTSNKTNSKERKTASADASFDDLIDSFSKGNAEVKELLGEWLKVRKAKRAAMTNKAIELNLKKLDELSSESGMSVVDYLKEIICRGWQAFYPIKTYRNQNAGTNRAQIAQTPSTDLDDVF